MNSKQISIMQSPQAQQRPNGIFYKAKLLAAGILIIASSYAFGQKASKESTPDTALLNNFKRQYAQEMAKRGVPAMRLDFLLSMEMPKELPDFLSLVTLSGDKVGVFSKQELELLKEKGYISITGKWARYADGIIYVFTKSAQAQPASQQ